MRIAEKSEFGSNPRNVVERHSPETTHRWITQRVVGLTTRREISVLQSESASGKPHVVSLPAVQIHSIAMLDSVFEAEDFATWPTS